MGIKTLNKPTKYAPAAKKRRFRRTHYAPLRGPFVGALTFNKEDKDMRLIFLFFTLFFSALSVSSEQTGSIQSIQALNDGRFIIFMENSRSNKPACASYDYWFVGDENSNAGKTQISILLTAKAAGVEVQISGTGSCVRWTDGEDIASVKLL